jgi:prephenate dehydrogenase
MKPKKVAIIGPGLLGGSIALALRKRSPRTRVAIWARRREALAEVAKKAKPDLASTELEPVVKDAEVIVLCVPIGAMAAIARKIAKQIKSNALITDVGSAKAAVVAELTRIFKRRGRFVGSHPMAGSEQAGFAAARADLFEGAVCIVTPHSGVSRSAAREAAHFWQLLGGEVRSLRPAEHDRIVAFVSHLPHLLAATLIDLSSARNGAWLNFGGNGLRDATRVASGPPQMWAEIFETNRLAMREAIHAMIEKLQQADRLLGRPAGMKRFLADAKQLRDQLKPRK